MIKMFMSSKLFVQYMLIGIVRIENTGETAAIYRKNPSRDWLEKKTIRKRDWYTISKLNTNSFCRQRAGLEVLIKVDR